MSVEFRFRSISQADAEVVVSWHYPEPFSFYYRDSDSHDLAELLDPTLRGDEHLSVEDELGALIAYFHYKLL